MPFTIHINVGPFSQCYISWFTFTLFLFCYCIKCLTYVIHFSPGHYAALVCLTLFEKLLKLNLLLFLTIVNMSSMSIKHSNNGNDQAIVVYRGHV